MPTAERGRSWHSATSGQVASDLATDPKGGLSRAEALRRLASDGPNELQVSSGPSLLALAAGQFRSLVVWLLIGAALASWALGEWTDGGAILAIVLLNAAIGLFQEQRAERAVAALARMTAPRARVVRDGQPEIVAAREIVRGDLLVLDAGDLVAADARLVDAARLAVNEAPLTGESEPVEKGTTPLPETTALADRTNQVFLGTSVTAGSGQALVVATGMQTEVGRIAGLIEGASREIAPLQRRLEHLGRQLLWACLVVVAVVSGLGWLRGMGAVELFIGAVSLAVAAVPEGLPAVATVALALGVERMARRNALVRRLQSVETLGSTQVICTDKTGTLTVGQMTVRQLLTCDGAWRVSGEGYGVQGGVLGADDAHAQRAVRALLWAAAACNEAEIAAQGAAFRVAGDTTEAALLVAAAKAGIRREDIEFAEPRIQTIPFDSSRKRMCVVRIRDGERVAYVKGAPEVILARCELVRTRGGDVRLEPEQRARLAQLVGQAATGALRVLAIAERTLPAHASRTSSWSRRSP